VQGNHITGSRGNQITAGFKDTSFVQFLEEKRLQVERKGHWRGAETFDRRHCKRVRNGGQVFAAIAQGMGGVWPGIDKEKFEDTALIS